MNDYEKLKKCFDEIGIKYVDYPEEPSIIIIDDHDDERIEFCFNDDGSYDSMLP